MTDRNSLEGLRGLHQDLIALEDSQLRNIERLWAELEARIDEFRKLLDKPPKKENSRNTVLSGKFQLDEEEYSINSEFIENTLQLSDTLGLDEIESARFILDAQQDVEVLDRSNFVSAVIRFHERRQFLLECLRLVLKCCIDLETEEGTREVLHQVVALILETKDGPARNGSFYVQKCLSAMAEAEKWLQALGERYQGTLTLGQSSMPEYDEVMGFQQISLGQQHESIGAVLAYLVKASYTGVEDFYKLLDHLPKLDRWNSLAVHYVPLIIAFTAQFGSPDGNGSLREARLLNSAIMDRGNSAPWALRNLQAATISWWLAEYSGWYIDQPLSSPLRGVDLEAEASGRSEAFLRALQDGAFQCTLSICSQTRPDDWADQMRSGLTQHLLRETPGLVNGATGISNYFQDLVMEQVEIFTDAFIGNMPDTLRRFRSKEDDQRKRINSRLQSDAHKGVLEQDFHLERFLLIIAYAFENRIEAAQSFWGDTDSNLYGFLQWASKRQSTPRVGAFSEMLRSISKGEECATAAHNFLLEESNTSSARIRRSSSISWAQIIAELNLYTSKIGDHSANVRPTNQYISRPSPDDIDEPESALMLECYLRLISHICYQSAVARSWLLSHPTFRILDVLFLLCSSTVPSRLHACAFNTGRALLAGKSTANGTLIWTVLDQWASGGLALSLNVPRVSKITNVSVSAEALTFEGIANDVEESSEFVGLLQSLISPAIDESGLNDSLPFPEHLGSAYRMPGIDPYIDFVMGKIFAVQAHQYESFSQHKILRLNILNFIAACLESFNEDLVILANRSNVPVDEAMNASSLSAYVRLHPFSRVMEWMFNERVLIALFAAAHQDIEEVSSASSDGPLVLGLLRSLDVMSLIMDLQSTYLDIVRPLIKLESSERSQSVHNPSLASFEDSVATHLDLIVDLGLYCGAGMQLLTVSSLRLLEKLASSRKLNYQPVPGLNKRLNGNRLIGVLEQQNDLERIERSLTLAMQFDFRELSQGTSAPGWTIKSVILDFLIHCLAVSPDKPSLAHALLGFNCNGLDVDIGSDSLFARGNSLFHAILRLVIEYPNGTEGMMQSWSLSVKQKGLQILSTLWASPLTSIFTLCELQTRDFLFALFLNQAPVEATTIWDGRLIKDPDFWFIDAALAFEQYLRQRCYICEYTSAQLRLLEIQGIPSLKARILSTLLGSTSMPDGQKLANLTIFDLLDFAELDFFGFPAAPDSIYFAELDFAITTEPDSETGGGEYNLKIVEEMMALHINKLRKNNGLDDQTKGQRALDEAQSILLYLHGANNHRSLYLARSQTLKAWVDLLTLVIQHCDLNDDGISTLVLQAFQLLGPKLEKYVVESTTEAINLANLIYFLLLRFDFKSSISNGARVGDVASDRLFQVFRTALRAIHMPEGEALLREILYNICYRYLTGTAKVSSTPVRRRHSTQVVKAAGEKLIDIICDDAHGGSGTCRISALLLLDSLVALAKEEKSNYMVDSLVRTNFIVVLVETIQDIPQELRETDSNEIPLLLSYYESKFLLLLSVAQSRAGAVSLMNSGLFSAVRASGLFSLDPDVGVETGNPDALTKYYKLVLSITRVITAVVLSRGSQNEQTIEQAKSFLIENRASVVAIFKRQAKIGASLSSDASELIDELVELFVVLFTMTRFLEYEEDRDGRKFRKSGFT